MNFCNQSFTIEPNAGEIHPGGFHQFFCTFHPKAGKTNDVTAFCEVQGRADRLALTMTGTGIGPKAILSYEMLDVGRIYIGAVHNFVVTVHNVGDIPATFSMERKCEYEIDFGPDCGDLEPGEAQNVTVTFVATKLGNFDVIAHCNIEGRVKPLILTLRGEVVNPTLRFDIERLDYGEVTSIIRSSLCVKNHRSVVAHSF